MTSIKGQTTRKCDITSLSGKVKTLPEQRQWQRAVFAPGSGSPGTRRDQAKEGKGCPAGRERKLNYLSLHAQNHAKFSQAFTNSLGIQTQVLPFLYMLALNSIMLPMKHWRQNYEKWTNTHTHTHQNKVELLFT